MEKMLFESIFFNYWKCNFPMIPDVGLSLCHNFPYMAGYTFTSAHKLLLIALAKPKIKY